MKWFSLLALSLFCIVPAHALDSDGDQPLSLSADELDLDLKTGKRIYRGNVLLEQGSIRIDCHELTAEFNAAGEVSSSECTGDPGRFKQRPEDSDHDLIGTAESITFGRETNLAVFSGGAEVEQGDFKLSGDRITYNLDTERVQVTGQLRENTRPNLQLRPRSGGSDAEEAEAEATDTETEAADTETDATKTETEAADTETDATKTETEATDTEAEATKTEAEAADTETDATETDQAENG